MTRMYEEIWNADQASDGVPPLRPDEPTDDARGYVVVNEAKTQDPNHKLLRAHIPDDRQETYRQFEGLLDNYELLSKYDEPKDPNEAAEVAEFLDLVLETSAMKTAREVMKAELGADFSDSAWRAHIEKLWFTPGSAGGEPARSGFEHVLVGEQDSKNGKNIVHGYHFWYKYHLDEGAKLLSTGLSDGDRITYQGTQGKNQEENALIPDVVTVAYQWKAYSYKKKDFVPLSKAIGGFWVGCSAAGLMALGTAAAHGHAKKTGVEINGVSYNLKIFANSGFIESFYPEFVKITSRDVSGISEDMGTEVGAAPVRILSALVNPKGSDRKRETITLVNVSDVVVNLTGWQVVGTNGKGFPLYRETLAPGEIRTLRITKDTAQFSNEGGIIRLVDNKDRLIHAVTYTQEQARAEGKQILFFTQP